MSGKIPKETKPPGTAELEAIRSIIFGEQEKYFNQRILELEEQIKKLQKELSKKYEGLNQRLDQETQHLTEQLTLLKNHLEGRGQSLEQKLKNVNNQFEKRVSELDEKKVDREWMAQTLSEMVKILQPNSEKDK